MIRVRLRFEDGHHVKLLMPAVPSGTIIHESREYALGMTTWDREEFAGGSSGWFVWVAAWPLHRPLENER